jgi:cytochrome c6
MPFGKPRGETISLNNVTRSGRQSNGEHHSNPGATKMKRTVIAILAVAAVGFANQALAQDAKALFTSKCAACHGADGKGETAMGKKMGLKSIAGKPAAEVEKITMDGKDKMPSYKGKLTDQQIKDIARYITAGLN